MVMKQFEIVYLSSAGGKNKGERAESFSPSPFRLHLQAYGRSDGRKAGETMAGFSIRLLREAAIFERLEGGEGA